MKVIYITLLVCAFFSCKDNQTEKEATLETKNIQQEVILENKTLDELQILRNEIYAKKGYYFSNPKFFAYFSQYNWYKPKKDTIINLSKDEKIQIERIKNVENKLKILTAPEGFKIKESSITKVDFDNDNIEDVIFTASDGIDPQEGGQEPLFIYLSSENKRHIYNLPSANWNLLTYSQENNSITYTATLEGSGRFESAYTLTYNDTLHKVELITYSRSSKANISDHKELIFDIIKGEYVMTYYNYNPESGKSDIFKRQVGITVKPIQPDFTYNYYSYLDTIGAEFEDY